MAISSTVVSVSIVLGTRAAQAQSFGTPAIFCETPYVGGKLYELSTEGLAAMVTDGFTINDRGYALASSMASQEPHADQVYVYGRSALTVTALEVTPLKLTVGAVYTFDITYKGVTDSISYTVTTGTVDAICDGLQAAIDASDVGGAGGVTVTPDNATATKLTLTGDTDGEPILLSGQNPAFLRLLDVSPDAGIATDLAAAASDFAFYRFVIDSYSEAENNAAAAWAEANKNRFFANSADTTNISESAGTGVAQDFFAAKYNRAVVCPSNDMAGNLAACVVGRQSAFVGTSNYAYQELAGVSADALTATHISNAQGKNCLIYALNGGTSHTFFGKAASGRSMRIQDAIDLLDARVAEAVLAVFLSNEYVPMSDTGFAMQEAAVRGVLSNFLAEGIIEPGFTVTVPKASSLSAADKVAGLLSSLKFSCVIPNDMTRVVVNGNVSF